MKTKLCLLFMLVAWLAGFLQAAAQDSLFFRISGPAATKITALRPDGSLVWTNELSGTNYMIQTCTTLFGKSNWVNYVQLPVTSHVNTNQIISFNPPAGMAVIPAGLFTMGDTADSDNIANPTNIYVSGFYLDVNLVSYGLWTNVYAYATANGYTFDDQGLARNSQANQPVETVNWYDCVKWCNARSLHAGLTPVYYTNAAMLPSQLYTTGDFDALYVNWTNSGYRLPTEAEWEKAARGGLTGQRFPWGDTISENQADYYASVGGYGYDLGPYNGYNTNYDTGGYPYTSPVGTFAANGYGVYDMAGNLSQWCWDWYNAHYGQPTSINPTGPSTGLYRVFRNGSWENFANVERCDYRNDNSTLSAYIYLGFRCAKGL